MTAPTNFPEGSLSLEQWQHVHAIQGSLNPAQANWLSGYFAGLGAGLSGGQSAALPSAPQAAAGRTLTILYGTETGNSTALAKTLAAEAQAKGITAELFDMANYKTRRLKDEQDLLVIVSTYGEGDPPQPAVGFFEFLEGARAPKLEGVRFSVLALGDSTYEYYCEAGKRVDKRLTELGAARLADRVDCDIDYEEPAAAWTAQLVETLAAEAKAAGTASAPVAAFAVPAATSAYDKKNPYSATVIENQTVVGRHSTKETRHVEIDLSGSGITYEPGDAIGIECTNDPAVVASVLDAAGLSADAPVTVKGAMVSLGEALTSRYEITLSTPRLLEHWGKLTGAVELHELGQEDRRAERTAFLHNHHLLDVLRKFPLKGIDPETFLQGLRPLQPRLYSIASSMASVSEEAHITVSPVRYDLHGERRHGVASCLLADRMEIGSTLPVYIQSNAHFRLPGDDVPVIMVGAGTGIAPYRAFMQEREARGAQGQNWIFFGDRNFRSDFLYQTEWQQMMDDGVLTRMDVAFSRDAGGKVYVQDRMRARAAELFAWLESGAHFYVCGDANNMAPDVHEALISIVESEGGLSREGAETYVRNLQSDHRYQRDVY